MRDDATRAAIVLFAVAGMLAGLGNPGEAQEASPRPTPTPIPCARPTMIAQTLRGVTAVTPPLAEQQGIQGTVLVIVSLDTQSRVVGTRIQSSPSAVLNQAALAAAQQSTFQTEIRDCRAIAGDYIYAVDFENKVTFATARSGERTVSVVGEGTVTRAPDFAHVIATIVTYDDVPATAIVKNDAALAALSAKLVALGIDRSNIHAASSFLPLSARSSTARDGYIASRQVEIVVDPIGSAGHTAAAAASLPSVDTVAIRYTLDDGGAAYREALTIALKDGENAARDAVTARQMHLGVLKHAEPLHDFQRSYISTVPYHLIPVVGGFKEPDFHIPRIEVYATATVTYGITP